MQKLTHLRDKMTKRNKQADIFQRKRIAHRNLHNHCADDHVYFSLLQYLIILAI